MRRKFEILKDEALVCPQCKMKGKDSAGGLFKTSAPLPCKQCGGLGFVDIQTGEEFREDDIYRAWMLVRDFFYSQAVSKAKQAKYWKERLVGEGIDLTKPTSFQVYPQKQKEGGFGD